MRLATWNLNNRVGKVRFRTEAADAALALDADVVVLTEYFPHDQREAFGRTLAVGCLVHQMLTREPPERANRILIASREPLVPDPLPLPDFDHQFPANLPAVGVPSLGLRVLGVRVPSYGPEQRVLLTKSWDWLRRRRLQACPPRYSAISTSASPPRLRPGVGTSEECYKRGGPERRRRAGTLTTATAVPARRSTTCSSRGGAPPATRATLPPRAVSCL